MENDAGSKKIGVFSRKGTHDFMSIFLLAKAYFQKQFNHVFYEKRFMIVKQGNPQF